MDMGTELPRLLGLSLCQFTSLLPSLSPRHRPRTRPRLLGVHLDHRGVRPRKLDSESPTMRSVPKKTEVPYL